MYLIKIQSFTVDKDGFYGHLYCPDKNNFGSKALLILGGGGMPYKFTTKEAAAFCEWGIAALAVGYFGVEGTPKTIIDVPLELVFEAAALLHKSGYESVVAVGISKGAELALAAASHSREINGVIALSPASRVNMGIGSGISWVNSSSWTFKGKELPYAYAKVPGWRAALKSIRARELTFRFVYEEAYRNAGVDSMIPVEKINGPVLVCGALEDSLWPSAKACDEIVDRLNKYRFEYPYKKLVYQYATHILLPFDTNYSKYFRVGRKYPKECRQTTADLKREIMDWL